MNKTEIGDSKHPLYRVFRELYSISFPIFEQRSEEQQEAAFTCPEYHLTAYETSGVFTGFISYWEFDGYIYIEHFAINRELRGKGYGSKILHDFTTSGTTKIVLLEIDPVTDKVSEARLRFYEKNGFFENPYPHTHPPYRNGYKAHPLAVLTTRRRITEKEYRLFYKELTDIVMRHKKDIRF